MGLFIEPRKIVDLKKAVEKQAQMNTTKMSEKQLSIHRKVVARTQMKIKKAKEEQDKLQKYKAKRLKEMRKLRNEKIKDIGKDFKMKRNKFVKRVKQQQKNLDDMKRKIKLIG